MQFISQFLIMGPALFIFMEVLELLLAKFVILDLKNDAKEMQYEANIDNFDFIIVGAGSSGCQLANRLSEKYSVLLLEAGGLPSPYLSIPVYGYLLNNQKPVDFAHRTVPQKQAAFGLNNRISHWPQGRQLGGSSTINGLIYIRGNVQGFNKIAKRLGDANWGLNNVLKYYNKIEDYNGWFDDGFHGKGGGMGVEKAYIMPFTSHLLDGGVELGYKIRDPNIGPYTEGFSPMDFYIRGGRRSDAFTETLRPVMERTNLIVRKFAYVTKLIIINGETVGVEYERHGKVFTVYASKEVILSAGTIQSSRILMLSGIGPKDDLRQLGIKSVVDLPVGKSLQDKYGALMGPFIVKEGYSFVRERDITAQALFRWFFTGTGPLSAARTESTHAILTNISRELGDTVKVSGPDIHTYVISSSTDGRTELDYAKSFNFKKTSLTYFGKARGKDSFLQLVTLSRPKGFGFVKLRNTDPRSPMIIDPKYLQNKVDVKILVEGMKFAVKVVEETKSMNKINAYLMKIPFPGCEKHEFKSDKYYECLARHTTITAYKYCGTAPIGIKSDPEAVVDNHLRVFGIKNLRVVDGSVLQLKYVSNNDATMRMLGQLASDIILNDWANPFKMAINDYEDYRYININDAITNSSFTNSIY